MKRIMCLLITGLFLMLSIENVMAGMAIVGELGITYEGSSYSVRVADGGGNYCIFYDGYYNLFFLDVTNPSSLNQAGKIKLPSNSAGLERRIARAGNYIYAPRSGTGNPNLDIVNISDPTNPAFVNSITPGKVRNLIVEGSYLYATSDGHVSVFDISSPSSPVLIWRSSFTLGVNDFDIAVKNGYIFAVGEGPLTIVDTINRNILATVNLGDHANRIVINENYMFIADRNYHLKVFNIEEPSNPTLLKVYQAHSQSPFGMAISINKLILSGYSGAGDLEVVDISDPANPVQNDIVLGLYARDIYAKGNYIYAATETGLKIIGQLSGSRITGVITSSIAGHVNLPVINANIRLIGTAYSATTNDNGEYSLYNSNNSALI